jgi:hypothetical protein
VYFIIFFYVVLTLSGCQETTKTASLMGDNKKDTTKVNPNSLVYTSKDKAQERINKIELAKIDAQAKIEVAKIKSKKDLEIAKIDAGTKKVVADKNAMTLIEKAKMEIQAMKEGNKTKMIMAIVFGVVMLFAILLWYLHKRKSLDLQAKIEAERLLHEKELKEKELQEQRLHKVLDMAVAGKLPQEIQKEVISAITNNNKKLIEG